MRKLENWLSGYLEYTNNTESPKLFHKWVGLSLISAALRKKVWFRNGRIKIHPNMYVVLVSEPGVARKTQAISYGSRLLDDITSIVTSADAITPQALVLDLSLGSTSAAMPDGSTFNYSAVTIFSGEFESFLGQKVDNTKMLVLLTDLFDSQKSIWEAKTKGGGSEKIPSPYINMLAATTPESLASSFPPGAIGGGLTARMHFVYYNGEISKVPEPIMSDEQKDLELMLKQDLEVISRIAGSYYWQSEKDRDRYYEWYYAYNFRSESRLCLDRAFLGWYSRKPTHLFKLAQLICAAEKNSRTITWKHFEEAIKTATEIERSMGNSFSAVGRSDISTDVNQVKNVIAEYKDGISEEQLLQLLWQDMDFDKLRIVVRTPLHSKEITRLFKHPETGKTGVFYYKTEYLPKECLPKRIMEPAT